MVQTSNDSHIEVPDVDVEGSNPRWRVRVYEYLPKFRCSILREGIGYLATEHTGSVTPRVAQAPHRTNAVRLRPGAVKVCLHSKAR